MKTGLSDTMAESIARTHLGIMTLEVQNRDHLDFHDVSVVAVKRALQAAYDLGRETHK